jgi:hypothetical protein
LINGTHLRARVKEASATDPYFGRRNNVEFSESVTRRVALRVARALAQKWGEPASLIAEALYFQLWIELCSFLPIRRVAMRLVREVGARTFAVHLPTPEVELSEVWADSKLEPLMLAWALQKRGADVVLVTVGVERASAIDIEASPVLTQAASVPQSQQVHDGLVHADGMRGVEVILKRLENPLVLVGGQLLRPIAFQTFALLVDRLAARGSLSMPLLPEVPEDMSPGLRTLGKVYSFQWPEDPLLTGLDRLLRPAFQAYLDSARTLVDTAIEAHVCDHLFLQSAVVSCAVKERSGTVTLWPHSANASQWNFRFASHFDRIVVVRRATAAKWQARFRHKPVEIVPELLLPRGRPLPTSDPTKPLTVIVLGGACYLSLLPLLNVPAHCRTYRRFFALSDVFADRARVVFKPKLESVAWLAEVLGRDISGAMIETRAVVDIDWPNMILVTIDNGSTGILEGIACGIPGIVVREQKLDDYSDLNPGAVPTGNAEFVWETIGRCCEVGYYAALIDKQRRWLDDECAPLIAS